MVIQVQAYRIGSQSKCDIFQTKKIGDEWVVTYSGSIGKLIIGNKIPVNDVKPVQLSKKFLSIDESVKCHCKKIKTNIIDLGSKEVEHAVDAYNIPTK